MRSRWKSCRRNLNDWNKRRRKKSKKRLKGKDFSKRRRSIDSYSNRSNSGRRKRGDARRKNMIGRTIFKDDGMTFAMISSIRTTFPKILERILRTRWILWKKTKR